MKKIIPNRNLAKISLACLCVVLFSCMNNSRKIGEGTKSGTVDSRPIEVVPKNIEEKNSEDLNSETNPCKTDFSKQPNQYKDTLKIYDAVELVNQIKSDRLIILENNEYGLESALELKDIRNLKIEGADSTKIFVSYKNNTVIELINSGNIHFENITIGQSEIQSFPQKFGVLRISNSQNVRINKCKIFGAGNFGLFTNDICNLEITDSEVSKCSAFLFELENSRNCRFIDVRFHDNQLEASVLGGFTYATEDVKFLRCAFENNEPSMSGNPAFNFLGNSENPRNKIVFSECTFQNNKGYKWYGEKIILENCEIDSSDFIGLK